MMGMDGEVGNRQSVGGVTGSWIYGLGVER